ncbi:MAG: sugar ABC transporter ATP-binding protein [Oscillospiraceae bacterium]|nr:sugar ABC transporter ATP-binding protein [Oscillospiraceae bacterium]
MSKLLEMRGITKRFPGTVALDDVSISLDGGEILALMGENGAGKSTLMKVLSGIHQMDEGEIVIEGEQMHFSGPLDARAKGIAIVHQELSIFPHMTVAENVMANRQPSSGGFVKNAALNEEATKYLLELGVNINPRTRAGSLNTSHQQLIEIARAISMNPKILIMDEPTSSLSDKEIDKLFEILLDLKKKGLGIIYISHKMKEILTLADRITVLRDGKYSGDLARAEATEAEIIRLMVGRDSHFVFPPKSDAGPTKPLLSVRHLSCGDKVKDVSFEVEEGKILGLFGLMGAGRTESARTIYGLEGKYGGEIEMDGKVVAIRTPGDAIKEGLAYLPEDRKQDGLFLGMPVKDNIVANILKKVSPNGIVNEKIINDDATQMVAKFQIKVPTVATKVSSLSGGNQQKVLLAKYYKAEPRVLFIDEPTRGIDVGAKSEIHRQLRELANSGKAVVVISSELIEVMGLSDKIVVMCEGRVTGAVTGDQMNESNIMTLATKFLDSTAQEA